MVQLAQLFLIYGFDTNICNARKTQLMPHLLQWWSEDEVETSDSQQPASARFIKTEQSEIDEQKELVQQLKTREREDMMQCIQLLQRELDKRFNEAVVKDARLREVESQLAEIQPSQSSETPTPQQVADQPPYKSTHSHFYTASQKNWTLLLEHNFRKYNPILIYKTTLPNITFSIFVQEFPSTYS